MKYAVLKLHELTITELYQVMQLRSEVFVLEQTCAYLDLDGLDDKCHHVIGIEDKKLMAYARILGPSLLNKEYAAIGRLAVKQEYRKNGIGKKIMHKAIRACKSLFPQYEIHIKAQNYLEKFYLDLNFRPNGNYFLEDFIPHQEMVLVKELNEGNKDK